MTSQPAESRLEALAQLAEEAGAGHLAGDSRALARRLMDGLFYVACVGQFKRGKSSLLNALIGEALLPVGVVPVTTVVTIVRHGERRGARVRFSSGDWQAVEPGALATYVAGEQNPDNARGVAAAEVFVPNPLLATGMCLVDTPGIGSVSVGSTEATRAFVPHVDAALVVLGADPPISADELALVEKISRQCPDLVFLLNKADRLSAAEREQAREFTRQVLARRLGRNQLDLFEVSATERLAGDGPEREWPRVTNALQVLARRSGRGLVRAAGKRGFGLLAGRLRQHLEEKRGAFLRPVEESARRMAALRTCVADAGRSLNDLGYLFSAEQDRLSRVFSGTMEEFLGRAIPEAGRELRAALREAGPRRGPALREAAIDLAHRISRRWLDRWLDEAQPAAESLYVEATRRFVDLAADLLERLARSGDPALAGLTEAVSPETGFRVRSRLYYTWLMTLTGRPPAGWLLDLIRSRDRHLKALDREVGAYLERLLAANANRIRSDFDDRVLESRRRFQGEIRRYLAEVARSAERALEVANDCRARGSRAVEEEVDRINTLSGRLEALNGAGGDDAP